MSARLLSKPLEERAAQQDGLLLRALMDGLFDGVVIIDQGNVIQAANPAVETIFGYKAAKLIGRDASVLVPLDKISQSAQFDPSNPAGAAGGKELIGRRADGAPFPMAVKLSETMLDGESAKVVVFRDLTEREQAERTIRELALRDPLTGLANRELFHRRLEEVTRGTGRRGRLARRVGRRVRPLPGSDPRQPGTSPHRCWRCRVADRGLRHHLAPSGWSRR